MNQKEFLTNLCEKNKDAVIIGSLGTISYDLKEIEHPNKILVKGAMGSVMGIGLGYALSSKKQVIVVVGDGSFLMKMGFLGTFMRYKLPNLKIYILNNQIFKSTGTQETNFPYIQDLVSNYIEIINVA